MRKRSFKEKRTVAVDFSLSMEIEDGYHQATPRKTRTRNLNKSAKSEMQQQIRDGTLHCSPNPNHPNYEKVMDSNEKHLANKCLGCGCLFSKKAGKHLDNHLLRCPKDMDSMNSLTNEIGLNISTNVHPFIKRESPDVDDYSEFGDDYMNGEVRDIELKYNASNASQRRPYDVHFILARAIQTRKNIVITPSFTIPRDKLSVEKEKAWEQIRMEMVNAGVQRFAQRTWRTVRDVDWQHLRRRVVNKVTENIRTHNNAARDLSELDMIVLDAMGKVSADGVIDFSDLTKTDSTDDNGVRSVGSERAENDDRIINANNILADMIALNSSNGINADVDCLPIKRQRLASSNGIVESTEAVNDEDDHQIQWENIIRDLTIANNQNGSDAETVQRQMSDIKVEHERLILEMERYRLEQERYKVQQERWKAEAERCRAEEAKLRLERLKREQ